MPDFAFKGPGVRITGTTPDSPAQKAGMQKGDIITKIDDFKIENLRNLSQALAKLKPGDEITLVYLRAGEEKQTKVKLVAR